MNKANISFANHVINFWWGCTKLGQGCHHCYAKNHSARLGYNNWGTGKPRRKIEGAIANLQKLTQKNHQNTIIYCSTMSDLFDIEVPFEWFEAAWSAILQASNLKILISTRRLPNIMPLLSQYHREALPVTWPDHVALIASISNQKEATRDIPTLLTLKHLLNIPIAAINCQPLLEPIDIRAYLANPDKTISNPDKPSLDWIIAKGETGKSARPVHPDWIEDLKNQCLHSHTPFYFEGWGKWKPHIDRDKQDPDWILPYSRYARSQQYRYLNITGGQGFHGDRFHVMTSKKTDISQHVIDQTDYRQTPCFLI